MKEFTVYCEHENSEKGYYSNEIVTAKNEDDARNQVESDYRFVTAVVEY